jgi:hypothetical protein
MAELCIADFYLNSLCGSLAYKFGYGNDQEKFKQEAHKFSLLNDGTLAKPCTKLFLVNVSCEGFSYFSYLCH